MEKEMLLYSTSATALALLAALLFRIFMNFWWRPLQLKRCFESQGIKVLPFKFFSGNALDMAAMLDQALSTPMESCSHGIHPRVLPHFYVWTKTYGKEFIFWFGNKPILYVSQPELVKEILIDKCRSFTKRPIHSNPLARQFLGQGLVTLETGDVWATHRKIISPAFHVEFLKGMIPHVLDSCANMLDAWREKFLNNAAELEVSNEFHKLTSDVISRTAFGSTYQEGKHFLDLQAKQVALTRKLLKRVYLPGSRFLPTQINRECWRLEKEIRSCLKNLILSGNKTTNRDVLGLMLAANKNQNGNGDDIKSSKLSHNEIIDECKTFYLAGQETTAGLLTWTLLLLGMHQNWQDKARNEVFQVCGKDVYPNVENINSLKIVGMILNEVLRLYPVIPLTARETCKPTTLGNVFLPAGTELLIPILALHHEPELWGEDADEFNPARFSQGIASAVKHPLAYLPFGFGPRICIGMNFALIEAKVVIAMILQRFYVALSPSYVHAPAEAFSLQPQRGSQIILRMV